MSISIESSLRRRAAKNRYYGALWIISAILILAFVYFSLPLFLNRTLTKITLLNDALQQAGSKVLNVDILIIAFFIIGLITAFAASYICFKSALIEIEMSARLTGLADALCVAGKDLDQFEKAASIFVPRTRYLLSGNGSPMKDLKPITELIKLFRH